MGLLRHLWWLLHGPLFPQMILHCETATPENRGGFRFCGIPKNLLRVKIIFKYFTGIFYLCMTTAYKLFISHTHVLWKMQHWLKLLAIGQFVSRIKPD